MAKRFSEMFLQAGFLSVGFLAAVTIAEAEVSTRRTQSGTNPQASQSEKTWSNPITSWRYEAYSADELRTVYRALYNRGFFFSDAVTTDLTRPDLVDHIRRYQAYIAADPTGYLSIRQVKDLLFDPGTPTPWEIRQADRKRLLAGKAPEESGTNGKASESELTWSDPVNAWRYDAYSTDELKTVYRALYNRGFFFSDAVTTDFTRPDLVDHIRRYQAYIAADPTGYLSIRQVKDLLADPGTPTPWEIRQADRKLLLAEKAPDESSNGRSDWQELAVSSQDKRQIYRSLYHLGLATSAEMTTDFSFRLDLIRVVRTYQQQNGFLPTGFLTREQVAKLLAVDAPLLPSEQQARVFEMFGSSAVLSYFRELGQQEYGISKPVSAVVKRFQGRLGMPKDGYVSMDLFEKSKTIPLKVKREQLLPQSLFRDIEELPSHKDWRLWTERNEEMCEAITASIHVDGFTGSAWPSSISLYRGSDWPYNAVDTSIRLENWQRDAIAELRVRGRSYYFVSVRGNTRFVAKDGKKLKSARKNYSEFINDLLRANGFDVTYETVFDTKVVTSFSALGLTRQLRALMEAC